MTIELSRSFHPETIIDGFTAHDGSIRFFGFVQAVLLRTKAAKVLDFGAGRGAGLVDDTSCYRRHVRDLRAFGAHVTACDVDDVVRTHPASDSQSVIKLGEPLPFPSSAFDVIVSDMTFEHIADAPFVARELLRVLKPGGTICVRTPNRLGYVRLMSSLVPNALHRSLLARVQPGRKSEDVFPTVYKMNDLGQVRKLFTDCEVVQILDNAEPAYHFGSRSIYRFFLLLHHVLPNRLSTTAFFFIRKPLEKSPLSVSQSRTPAVSLP